MLSVARAARAVAARSFVNARTIATSGKKNETAVTAAAPDKVEEKTNAKPEPIVNDKNWVSYGFDFHDRAEDDLRFRQMFFHVVTLCFVGCGFYLAYRPDFFMRDWASREAFLELRRREAAGLPLVDANYVDPATVHLPSDEELGNTEIII